MNTKIPPEPRAAGTSSLVRRLVQAQRDPVKRRARQWLVAMDDQRLSEFGLTPQDIAALRGAQPLPRADQRSLTASRLPIPSARTRSSSPRHLDSCRQAPRRSVDEPELWFHL